MKTGIGASFVYETNYFDITSGDGDTAKYIKRKLNELSETARKFLANKHRQKYYLISGFDTTFAGETDCRRSFFVAFTDEEVEFVSHALIDIYNKGVECSDKIPYDTNICELCADMPISEVKGENTELDNLLDNKIFDLDLNLEEINFDSHFYRYGFTIIPYNLEDRKTLEPITFKVELSDDEYIYLLSQKLFLKEQFTFNRLLLTNHALAQKIAHLGCDILFDTSKIHPYVVEFTELDNDVTKILSQTDKQS